MDKRTMTVTTEIDIYGLIGRNIKERRTGSQLELANKCYINRATISNIENGNQKVSIELLITISEALDCKLTDLLNGWEKLK